MITKKKSMEEHMDYTDNIHAQVSVRPIKVHILSGPITVHLHHFWFLLCWECTYPKVGAKKSLKTAF